jgi:hypothetical protein
MVGRKGGDKTNQLVGNVLEYEEMNERWIGIAMKAHAQTGNEFDLNHKPLDAFLAKFAELIVQECAQLLFAESERLYSYSSECDNMHDSDEAEVCAEKCIDNIKMIEQYFGVEE